MRVMSSSATVVFSSCQFLLVTEPGMQSQSWRRPPILPIPSQKTRFKLQTVYDPGEDLYNITFTLPITQPDPVSLAVYSSVIWAKYTSFTVCTKFLCILALPTCSQFCVDSMTIRPSQTTHKSAKKSSIQPTTVCYNCNNAFNVVLYYNGVCSTIFNTIYYKNLCSVRAFRQAFHCL